MPGVSALPTEERDHRDGRPGGGREMATAETQPDQHVFPVWKPTNVLVIRARLTASRQPVTAANPATSPNGPGSGATGSRPSPGSTMRSG